LHQISGTVRRSVVDVYRTKFRVIVLGEYRSEIPRIPLTIIEAWYYQDEFTAHVHLPFSFAFALRTWHPFLEIKWMVFILPLQLSDW
jgi:hypothetical protein